MTDDGPDPLRALRRSMEDLGPAPGTFEQVVAEAGRRRRRRIQLGTAVAAVVAVAAGAGLFVGAGSGGSDGVVANPPPASVSGPPTAPAGTASPLSGMVSPSPGPSRPPVPAGFVPRSVTFVGGGRGWLLGSTTGCAACASLLRTDDYGATWYGGAAPAVPLATAAGPDTAGTIRDVRFTDGDTGYAFGGALQVTHDGGATWAAVTLPDGTDHVADLAARDGQVFLVADRCGGAACADGRLYRIGTGGTPQRVAGWPVLGADARIALNQDLVAVAARTTTDGVAYQLYVSQRADGSAPADRGQPCGRGLGGLAAGTSDVGTSNVLWAGCDGGAGGADVGALVSTDAGAHFRATAAPPVGRGTASAAALDADRAVITGQDRIAATSDGGATWRQVVLPPPTSPELQLGFVGFTDDQHGYVIAGAGGPAGLWRTGNGGGSWTYVPFR